MLPTPRTLLFLSIGLIPLLFAGFRPSLVPAIALYDFLIIFLGLIDYLMARSRKGYNLSRDLPHTLTLGQPNVVALHIENRSQRTLRLQVRDDFPPACGTDFQDLQISLPPFRHERIRYRVYPGQRGNYEFGDIHFRLIGPLGLSFYQGKKESRTKITAYPVLQDLRRFRLLARYPHSFANEGLHLLRREGEGREFQKLREYLPDDPFRDIDWKATARKQKPITRVHETERSQTIYLCLDAGRMMATRIFDGSKFDCALKAALILAHLAIRQDDRVGMAAFSSGLDIFLPAKKGKAQFGYCLRRLNGVNPSSTFVDYREFFRQFLLKKERRSLMVIFTDFLDHENCQGLLDGIRILRTRHLPLIVTIRDCEVVALQEKYPRDVSDLYCILAASEALNERKVLLQYLQREGIQVLEALPEDLSAATVSRYLEIKRKGML
ncbi:MAG: DUF58 domain-containing protein [bacterium]